jgi:hypothetical protein
VTTAFHPIGAMKRRAARDAWWQAPSGRAWAMARFEETLRKLAIIDEG